MIMIQCRLEKVLVSKKKKRLYFNSTVVRSDYRRLVCHDVVRFVIY